MMGDGVIDLKGIRRDDRGSRVFTGHQEVEIFSAKNWWKQPGEEVLSTCIERLNSVADFADALRVTLNNWLTMRILAYGTELRLFFR